MKTQCIIVIALILAACSGADESSTNDLLNQTSADQNVHDHGSDKAKDMKALFGDDYEPGDIGHSFGEIISIVQDGRFLIIDHGPIHGIDMAAMKMEFAVLADVDLSDIDEGDKVEFLVKKSSSGTYEVMAICDRGSEEVKCLENVMGK